MVVLGGPIPKNMVTITGTSGPVTHTTNVAVTVTAPAPGTPDFTLTTSVDSLTITAGNSGTAKITLDPKYGFDNTVDLTITAPPIGPAVTLSRTSISGKGSATVTINVSNDIVSGTYTVTVLGTSGNLAHKAQITVTISGATSQTQSDTSSNPSKSNIFRIATKPLIQIVGGAVLVGLLAAIVALSKSWNQKIFLSF